MCFGQQRKHTTTAKQKANIKILAKAGDQTRITLAPNRMRYLLTNESTKQIN